MDGKKVFNVLSRALLTSVFIAAGIDKLRHRENTFKYMASKGMPTNDLLLNGAIAMELGVAPAVAFGVLPRFSASMLSAFLIPTTLIFHDFWRREGSERQIEQTNFIKNLAIIGGLASLALHDFEAARQKKMQELEPMDIDRPDYLDDIREPHLHTLRAA